VENLIRCKLCGYVTKEGSIKDKCPACGVSAKMFEPYKDPVSESRRQRLGLHLHPIIVHFPQAFTSFLLFTAAVSFTVSDPLKEAFIMTLKVLTAFLPLAVSFAFLSGLFDGKMRFKRLATPYLKRKILVGTVFFLVSVAMAFTAFTSEISAAPSMLTYIVLSFIAACCSILLGWIGGRLLDAKIPG
jgi:uncharacterized membrane protein